MKQRILIAEDDPSVQQIYSIVLSKAGYEVKISPDGKELYNKQTPSPNLVILDKHLADRNGVDICKYLKSKPATKNIPVIMISASPGLAAVAKDAGAEDFLEKPFTINVLLDKIQRVLRRYTSTEYTFLSAQQ